MQERWRADGSSASGRGPKGPQRPGAIAVLRRGGGQANQAAEANVSIFDRMTDDKQHAVLAVLEALRYESGHYLTVKAD
jgi:hypothetical protein